MQLIQRNLCSVLFIKFNSPSYVLNKLEIYLQLLKMCQFPPKNIYLTQFLKMLMFGYPSLLSGCSFTTKLYNKARFHGRCNFTLLEKALQLSEWRIHCGQLCSCRGGTILTLAGTLCCMSLPSLFPQINVNLQLCLKIKAQCPEQNPTINNNNNDNNKKN